MIALYCTFPNSHSVEIPEILSHTFFEKISWKQFFTKEIIRLNSWFDEKKIWLRENFSFFYLHCEAKLELISRKKKRIKIAKQQQTISRKHSGSLIPQSLKLVSRKKHSIMHVHSLIHHLPFLFRFLIRQLKFQFRTLGIWYLCCLIVSYISIPTIYKIR